MAVEDLHWADTASVDLLTLLLELTDFQPIMFLVTSRPETEGDTWTFRLHAERNFGHRLTELRLAPLAAEASQRLADNLLRVPDLPETIRDRILQRSEGNPFFLEEIIRGLIEEGVLRREGDRWTAGTATERWAIPTTLLGVIAARIDRLPGPAKALLQRAAVIGRSFGYRALRELSDEPAELDRTVAHLLRAELIRESAALPERQYLFKHALTQEAAEASLLTEQRHELHGRVARYLESTLGEGAAEQAALLAHHWYRAGQWDHALEHTLAAADRARGLHDRPAAIGHYWRALEILGACRSIHDTPKKWDGAPRHRWVRAPAGGARDEIPAASGTLDAPGGRFSHYSDRLLDRLPPTERRQQQHADAALALVRLPGFARNEAMVRQGVEHLDRAIESATHRGDVGLLVRTQALKGFVVADEALLKEALAGAEDRGDPLTLAWAIERYGQYLGQRGRWEETLAQARRAIAIYAEQGSRYQQAMNVTSGGRCYSARGGRLADALRYAAEFRTMAAELGEAPLLAWRAMEAEPYLYQGAWGEAIRVAEESLPIAWQIGETNVILFGSAWLALAYLHTGKVVEARRVADGATAYAQTSRDSTAFALSHLTIAAALTRLAEGAPGAALEQARRALDYADRGRFRLEQGAAHRALGQAYAATGSRAEAVAAFRTSLEILEDIRSQPEVGQTLLAYGLFRLAEDPGEGRALIERACAVFEEIGAGGWLAEARAVLGLPPG